MRIHYTFSKKIILTEIWLWNILIFNFVDYYRFLLVAAYNKIVCFIEIFLLQKKLWNKRV